MKELSKRPKVKKRENPFWGQALKASAVIIALVALVAAYQKTFTSVHQSESRPATTVPLERGFRDDGLTIVTDIPGKGKGVLAAKDIKRGERVLLEMPLITMPHEITSSPQKLIGDELSRLSPEERQEFRDLSYVNLPPDVDPEVDLADVAVAIFQTNAVTAGTGRVGIFPRFARLNHGCARAFNVVYSWREKEGALAVHALQDIKEGEELLTTYTNTKRPRAERRVFLQKNYGFNCECAVCSLPDDRSAMSDALLSRMSDLYGKFATWGDGATDKTITGAEATRFARLIWKTGEEVGYRSERGQLAADAAWVAAAHSDANATSSWATLAAKWYAVELGADSDHALEMEVASFAPETHSAWGTKDPMAVEGADDLE